MPPVPDYMDPAFFIRFSASCFPSAGLFLSNQLISTQPIYFLQPICLLSALQFHPPVEEEADQDGQKRPHGRRKPHRVEGRGKIHSRDPGTGNPEGDDGNNIVQERIDRPSVGTEKTAEAEVDACDHAVDGSDG